MSEKKQKSHQARVAELVRQDLKTKYPDIKFSVASHSSHSGYTTVVVKITKHAIQTLDELESFRENVKTYLDRYAYCMGFNGYNDSETKPADPEYPLRVCSITVYYPILINK